MRSLGSTGRGRSAQHSRGRRERWVTSRSHPCGSAEVLGCAAALCSFLVDPFAVFRTCHGGVDVATFLDACDPKTCSAQTARASFAFELSSLAPAERGACVQGQVCAILTTHSDACTQVGAADPVSAVDACGVCFGDGTSCLGSHGACTILRSETIVSVLDRACCPFSGCGSVLGQGLCRRRL